VIDSSTLKISPSAFICPGSSTILFASGATTYNWTPATGLSSTNIANPIASPNITTTYTVTGATGSCISAPQTVVVNVSSLHATVCCNTSIIAGNSTTLNVSPLLSKNTYSWMPVPGLSCNTCPDPIATPAVTTTYYVVISDSNGCMKRDSVTITVKEDCGEVFVPNAFSPNGDHENDLECVYGKCIETIDFSIYDRWGNRMFHTNDPKQCWNGVHDGQFMNTGVFVYYLRAELTNGDRVDKKGNITLIR
ncbi:MAG TPA: gliding motility-associated C-terminal domain-containing protein, partial [Bacteroidia bacterium]|nr:gliding motility-associated C-terminal domain-containing protein [Bacteroidia bacterium]